MTHIADIPDPATAARTSTPLYAALDLGTNNCRLLIGAPAGDGFRVMDSYSRIVRLGEGLQATGALSDAAMDRAIAALHACADRLRRRRPVHVRAIATEACRRAANGAAFIERVRAETGIAFDVIGTREEAELALESCAPLLRGAGRRALLFDIGGGSTELAWVRLNEHPIGPTPPSTAAPAGRQPQLIGYVSLPVGVVTLSEQFNGAAFTEDGYEAMVADVAARLRAFESVHCIAHEVRDGGVRLVGTSGTVTTLAGVALGLAKYRRPAVDGVCLPRDVAEGALARLRTLGRDGLMTHPCVGPDRVEFVLPGCAIFEAIWRTWPASLVTVADRGLREGLLLRMMRTTRSPPPRHGPRPGAPLAHGRP